MPGNQSEQYTFEKYDIVEHLGMTVEATESERVQVVMF